MSLVGRFGVRVCVHVFACVRVASNSSCLLCALFPLCSLWHNYYCWRSRRLSGLNVSYRLDSWTEAEARLQC